MVCVEVGMIEAETIISRDMTTLRQILVWCSDQFGQPASSLDNIGERFTWGYRAGVYETSFHFAQAKDCTFFILRWT